MGSFCRQVFDSQNSLGDVNKKELLLYLVCKENSFKIAMQKAVNWYNDYAGQNLNVWTTITQHGIFGFTQGCQVWIGLTKFAPLRGIRNGI